MTCALEALPTVKSPLSSSFFSPPPVSGDQTEGPVHSRQATQSGLLDGFKSRSDLQTYTARSLYENKGDLEGGET